MSKSEKNKSARCMADKKWFIVMAAVIVCFAFGPPQAGAGTAWLQKQKLLASDGAADDYFGYSVSISGDYAIVGAWRDDDKGIFSGSAYIFRWDGTNWSQQKKLTASDGAAHDYFGYSVSISGDYAIVGAYGNDNEKGISAGSAYIFKRDGESWVEQQKLTASDGDAVDGFGYSVSISGDLAIVGAPCDDDKGFNSGSTYIFRWNGTSWSEQAKLLAADGAAEDLFGESVSITCACATTGAGSGDYAIVGAPYDDDNGSNSGSAYIFRRDGTAWVQQQKLTASDGAAGDFFGYSVSISGDYAIVGAYLDDDKGDVSGSAYIFRWDGTAWSQQQKLTASDGTKWVCFGLSVSITCACATTGAGSGGYAIVGAFGDNVGRGSAYIFRWDGTQWSQQQKLTASDGAEWDRFGWSVSISGDYAIVGAYCDDDLKGSAYIFIPTGTGEMTLLAPNGGEKLVAGSTYDITWDTNGVVEDVFIEYSANNGGSWTAIDTVVNTGSYPWLVPDVNSSQCIVWISDAGYPAAGDVSSDVFRIYVCTLTHDYNHDCFVDFFDFSHFATEWLRCGDPADPNCRP